MKIAALISRLLLGLIFFVFGLNGFLQFIHMPPPTGLALQYFIALAQSHYISFVWVVQLLGGVLLLAGRYVPLALTILGPVIVNILLFHITMAPAGLPLAFITALLWFVVFSRYRAAFVPLFTSQAIV